MSNPVDCKVAKEPELKVSAKGLDYIKLTLVEDTEDGAKWHNGVAFGTFAKSLGSKLKKGMDVRVFGKFSVKEYNKKDGGVGTSNEVMISKVILEGGAQVDKFGDAPKTEPAPF